MPIWKRSKLMGARDERRGGGKQRKAERNRAEGEREGQKGVGRKVINEK